MRPVHRGLSPKSHDFVNYRDALSELVSRLGPYCSYCERMIVTQLAVEHIQPKALPQYAALEGRWENFLLACVNCNSTKKDKDFALPNTLLPDRDNTFAAYQYTADGVVKPVFNGVAMRDAQALLKLVGLDKAISKARDSNGKLVAIDRVAQRMEAWACAEEAKAAVNGSPHYAKVRELAVKLAAKSGFFCVWMAVFDGDAHMRSRFIDAFSGTQRGCFDASTRPISPCPNPDGLPHGGKV